MSGPGRSRSAFQPVLLVLHVAAGALVMAAGAHAVQEIFRETRRFPLLPAGLMGLEIFLIFQWGLYYATRSEVVRRAIRTVLWLHVVLAPLLAGVLLAWPDVVAGRVS